MEYVTISRHWRKPEIHTTVTTKEIALSIKLEDYLSALVEELGSPWSIMTKAQLAEKLRVASATVVSKVKRESTKVMR